MPMKRKGKAAMEKPAVTDQAQLWNGPSGHAWVEAQELLDRMFKPFEQRLVDAAVRAKPERVLDIGCGTGATTVAIARQLPQTHCVGLDISEPMIEAARQRARHQGIATTFICADASSHAFEAGAFDLIASRFGVMFFDDPIAAFGNLRRASRPGGALIAIAWRNASENPFMTTAERAAAPILPDLPPRTPNAPGQFGFADRKWVQEVLDRAGWRDIEIAPLDVACTLPASELEFYFTRLGPLARVLAKHDAETRTGVVGTVRDAFDPFLVGEEVRFTAACWQITARA